MIYIIRIFNQNWLFTCFGLFMKTLHIYFGFFCWPRWPFIYQNHQEAINENNFRSALVLLACNLDILEMLWEFYWMGKPHRTRIHSQVLNMLSTLPQMNGIVGILEQRTFFTFARGCLHWWRDVRHILTFESGARLIGGQRWINDTDMVW